MRCGRGDHTTSHSCILSFFFSRPRAQFGEFFKVHATRARKEKPKHSRQVFCMFLFYTVFISSSMCAYRHYSCLPASSCRRADALFYFLISFHERQLKSARSSHRSAQCPAGTHPPTQHLCSSLIAFYFSFFLHIVPLFNAEKIDIHSSIAKQSSSKGSHVLRRSVLNKSLPLCEKKKKSKEKPKRQQQKASR